MSEVLSSCYEVCGRLHLPLRRPCSLVGWCGQFDVYQTQELNYEILKVGHEANDPCIAFQRTRTMCLLSCSEIQGLYPDLDASERLLP